MPSDAAKDNRGTDGNLSPAIGNRRRMERELGARVVDDEAETGCDVERRDTAVEDHRAIAVLVVVGLGRHFDEQELDL